MEQCIHESLDKLPWTKASAKCSQRAMSLATLKTSITVNKQTTALYPVIFVYQLVVLIQKKGGIAGFFVHEFFPVLTSILKDKKT